MRDLFAPSIMCGDLLNLEEEIRTYEKAGADMIHFDIMDTTFTNTTMLPPLLLPAIHRATRLPVDVHVMVDRPERFIETLLPYCKDTYVSIHIESTKEIQNLLKAIKQAGGRPSVALNPGTSLCMVEEVVPLVDMMLVLLCNAGSGPKQDIDEQLSHKLQKAKMMLEQYGKTGALLEVDGNVSFENARRAKSMGANVFVLGTASIYNDKGTVPENMGRLREYLENN